MSYKDKPQLHLYEYKNNSFSQIAIIDDFQEVSFEHNLYSAGTFTITINYNIPNALLFKRGMFIQFGSDPYDFGEILSIRDTIGEDGKGSQIRTITGYDARYIFKRRIIKNLNSNGLWKMTAKGELCLRNLIADQCGVNAEEKRRLPIINTIPSAGNAIGKEYSVSEQFSNLYEVCKTIATQSEIGWRVKFENGSLALECFEGTNRSNTVQFSTDFDSLRDGEFSDSSESFSNAVYIGGKGQNDERDIYEGEDGTPNGLDRFEAWDDQSQMTTTEEYTAEALSMLTQYGQTVNVSGNGLAKCPYIFGEEYDIGDIITIAFSGKKAVVQILSVTERWAWNQYDINFSFGKPQNNLAEQLQLMLRKIQGASNKANATESVKWYTIPTATSMPADDVTFNTIGFTGTMTANSTFTLYRDSEGTGAKSYNVYCKNLSGNYTLILTTGVSGATNFTIKGGQNIVARILVDENGNIVSQGMTATSVIESGNNQPVTSEAVANSIYKNLYVKALSSVGWYKICTFGTRNRGATLDIDLCRFFNNLQNESHKIKITYSWLKVSVEELASSGIQLFDKIRVTYNNNNYDTMAVYVHYNAKVWNDCYFKVSACQYKDFTPYNFETDSLTWESTIEYNLGSNGLYLNGQSYNLINNVLSNNSQPVTSNAVYMELLNYVKTISKTDPTIVKNLGIIDTLNLNNNYEVKDVYKKMDNRSILFAYTINLKNRPYPSDGFLFLFKADNSFGGVFYLSNGGNIYYTYNDNKTWTTWRQI